MLTPCRRLLRQTAAAALALLPAALLLASDARSAVSPLVNPLPPLSDGLSTPVRLAVDPFGSMYVTDPRGGGIVKLDSAGRPDKRIRLPLAPLGVAVARDGSLLVSQGTTVAVVHPDGTPASPASFGTFKKANGITVDNNGTIYVADSHDHTVQVFSSAYAPLVIATAAAGKPANSFGSFGTGDGQFRQPTGIAYEKSTGLIAVADTQNGRIQFFDTNGTFKKSLGSFGSGPLKFTSPQAVAFEYTGDGSATSRIYVVDSFQGAVQSIDAASGAFLRYLGSYGRTAGKLATPGDLLLDQRDPANKRLVVANGTGTLALFGIDAGVAASGPSLTLGTLPTVTNLSSITVSGTTDSGAAVKVNGAAVTVSGTSWSSPVTLAAGYNTITVEASRGGVATVKTATVEMIQLLNEVPVVLTLDASTPTVTNTPGLTLSGTTSTGAAVTVNGAPVSVTGTSWSYTTTLAEGSNSLQVTATLGQSVSSLSATVSLITTPPVLTAVLPGSGAVTARPVQTIAGTVSGSAAVTVTVSVNGVSQSVPVSDGSYSVAVVLSGGQNSIAVTAADAAGNRSSRTSTVNYNPLAPSVTVDTPSGTVSGTPALTLTGTVPAGTGSVSVNGVPATLNGTAWSAPVTLVAGINPYEITAGSTSGGSSTVVTTVAYLPGAPSLTVASPSQDRAVATGAVTVTGSASRGSVLTATINGAPAPVVSDGSGNYSVTLPSLTVPGTYAVAVSASDSSGVTSTSVRSIVYDPVSPVITVASAVPQAIKLTASKGVLIVRDKNGPVRDASGNNVSGGTSIDLTGSTYDPATLNIYALSPAGLSSRNGDLDGDGSVTIADALKALRISANLDPASFSAKLAGDVAPMVSYDAVPDGKIGLDDAVVILNKVLGLLP